MINKVEDFFGLLNNHIENTNEKSSKIIKLKKTILRNFIII